MTSQLFEPVHAITYFWDSIRGGVADYQGRPHYFEEEFDEVIHDYTGYFRLTPVDDETFTLVLESDQIERWYWAGYHAGEIERTTCQGCYQKIGTDI